MQQTNSTVCTIVKHLSRHLHITLTSTHLLTTDDKYTYVQSYCASHNATSQGQPERGHGEETGCFPNSLTSLKCGFKSNVLVQAWVRRFHHILISVHSFEC